MANTVEFASLPASSLRAAIAGWQQPLVLAILARSTSPEELVSSVDRWCVLKSVWKWTTASTRMDLSNVLGSCRGRTVLHLACKAGNNQVLQVLNTSLSLHSRDIFGRTALHLAAIAGESLVVLERSTLH